MYRIFIVEDDPAISRLMSESLERWGFSCRPAADFLKIVEEVREFSPHLIILDISLPFYNGFYWCEQLRRESSVPVIFVSSHTDNMDVVMAVNMGADDYITKPFAAEELVARMETVLRRTGRGGRELCAYDVVLDTVNHTARRNGEPVELRRLEYDLLELLMRNRGAALYRDVMYERVWGGIPDTESLRTVDTHIARLRKKLGWMDKIETVYKIGYRLKKED